MLKRYLAMITAAVMLFMFTACSGSTAELPSEGWTHDSFTETLKLGGEPFTLPCDLSVFSNKFELKNEKYYDKDTEILNGLSRYIILDGKESGYYYAQLNIGDDPVGRVFYYDDGGKSTVFSVYIGDVYKKRTVFTVNGVKPWDNFNKYKKALGDSFEKNPDNSYLYCMNIKNPDYPDEKLTVLSPDGKKIEAVIYSIIDVQDYRMEND